MAPSMSPDLYFALSLIVKMAVTAGFVLVATLMAERAGPFVAGLVATLPIGAGPVYVFLALDHDAQFISLSAVASLAINAANVAFALIYALLAQERPVWISLPAAFAVWLVMALMINAVSWTIGLAVIVNVVVFAICLTLARPLRHRPIPRTKTRWTDTVLRAALVALLVGMVVTLSFRIGAQASGILAVFPMVLISIMLILQPRAGGPATAALMANAVLGLIGFAFACISLHYTATVIGVWPGLAVALAISFGWGLLMFQARKRGFAV
jgi:hypothetical protein